MHLALLLFLLPLVWAGSVQRENSSSPSQFPQERSPENDYLDNILERVRNFIKDSGHDSVALPYHKIVDKYYAGLVLKKGYIEGISHIYRHSDVKLDVSMEEKLAQIEVTLKVTDLHARYDLVWKCPAAFIFWWNKGHVDAWTSGGKVHAKLEWSLTPGSHPELTEFSLRELADASFKIGGMGLLNSVAELILDIHIDRKYIYPLVYDFVNNDAKKMINDLLKDVEIPDFIRRLQVAE